VGEVTASRWYNTACNKEQKTMSSQIVTLDIPSGLFTRLQKRAKQAKRSVEDETLELLSATVSADGPSDESQQALDSLQLLDDASVERAARSQLASELSAELESLHFKQQREGLTEGESQRCAELLRAYERAMLIRASAAALLRQRGLDIPNFAAQP
jgi:plasmid stability protein